MTNEEQRRIFGKNLTYFVARTQKSQKDIAKDLGVNYTTFNMWCLGKSMPTMGKVQTIANYFHIKNIDLIDDPLSRPASEAYNSNYYVADADKELLNRFHMLDAIDQARILERIDVLLGSDKYKNSMNVKKIS